MRSGGGTRERLQAVEEENAQLRAALESRIAIEQAKGVLGERLGLTVDEAFTILRLAARSSRTNLHLLARRVVEEGETPEPVVRALRRGGNGNGRPLLTLASAELELRRSRSARNENLYRNVNEAISRTGAGFSARGAEAAVLVCECARPTCTRRLELTPAAYEGVRSDPARFVIAPEHHEPELEVVVERARGYWVVGKLGAGAAVAAQLDPRRAP